MQDGPTIKDRLFTTLHIASHSDPLRHIVDDFPGFCTPDIKLNGDSRLANKTAYFLAHFDKTLGCEAGVELGDSGRQDQDCR